MRSICCRRSPAVSWRTGCAPLLLVHNQPHLRDKSPTINEYALSRHGAFEQRRTKWPVHRISWCQRKRLTPFMGSAALQQRDVIWAACMHATNGGFSFFFLPLSVVKMRRQGFLTSPPSHYSGAMGCLRGPAQRDAATVGREGGKGGGGDWRTGDRGWVLGHWCT